MKAARFQNASLRQKLIGVFAEIFLFAMVLMVVTSTVITWNMTKNKAKSHSQVMLRELEEDFSYIMTETENVTRFTMYENQIQEYLRQAGKGEGSYSDMLAIKDTLVNVILNKDYIESLSIYLPDGSCVAAGTSPAYATIYENIEKQAWFPQVSGDKGMYQWSISEFEQGASRMTCSRVINDKDTIQPLGLLVILLNPDYIDKLISKSGSQEDQFFLLDAKKSEIISPIEEETDFARNMFLRALHQPLSKPSMKDGYILTTTALEYPAWILANGVPVSYYWGEQAVNLGIILLVTIISLIFSMAAYTRFADSITIPIQRMIASMEQAEKENFKTGVEVEGKDEIGRLGEAYNSLIRRLNVLVNDVLRERLHSQQAELENLQAQINPHFLYNTLDCINWKAMINGQEEISEMITALSNMFRFSLSGNDKIVTLREELANVQDYLLIQQKRFGAKLHWQVEIPEECMQVHILKYILQPVVENSILHGVGETGEAEEVTITAAFQRGGLLLMVQDNGPGISQKDMELLLSGRQPASGKRHRHGVYNVNQRLKLQYGEAYGLEYASPPKGGTCAKIWIPGEEE